MRASHSVHAIRMVGCLAAALLLRPGSAQNAFEVASVKPADPNDPIVAWHSYPGGRVVITNFTLTMLIEAAYGVSIYNIVGGPSWKDQEAYSITARAPAGSAAAAAISDKTKAPPPPEILAMLRSLLEDRFSLMVHRETRQLPVYALVVGRRGPKLQISRDPSAEPDWSIRRGEIVAHHCDMAWLSGVLERHFKRTVLNQTGLTGKYDFHFKFDPRSHDVTAGADAIIDPTRPPLEDALETQTGLKLEETKSAVEVLVIDRARRPSAN